MDEDLKNTNGNINKQEPQKIVVVSGDGKIDISEVHDHLNVESPNSEDTNKKTIVIPPDKSNHDNN